MIRESIYQKISEGETKGAIDEILAFAQKNNISSKKKKEITIISNKYTRLIEEKRLGIVTDIDFRLQINQINNALLDLTELIVNPSDTSPPLEKIWQKIQGRFLWLSIIIGLMIILFVVVQFLIQKEKKSFQLAIQENSLTGFERFLTKHPKSKSANYIQGKIDSIHRSVFFSTIISEDIGDLKEYCRLNPDSKYVHYVQKKLLDLSIKPLFKVEMASANTVIGGTKYLTFDGGNKLLFIDNFNLIKVLDLMKGTQVSINLYNEKSSEILGLSISSNGIFFGFYNKSTSEIIIHRTTDGALVNKIKHPLMVFDIIITNDGGKFIVSDEIGSLTFYDKVSKIYEIKRKDGSVSSLTAYPISNNSLAIVDDMEESFSIFSTDGVKISKDLSLYLTPESYNDTPLFTPNSNFMILPIINANDDICGLDDSKSFNVYDINMGEFIYKVDNEKVIASSVDNNSSFFSFSSQYIFKRDIKTGNILDTLSMLKLAQLDRPLNEVDLQNRILATSANFDWDRIQFWDIDSGKQIWGTGNVNENKYCLHQVKFLNGNFCLTEDDTYLKIWETKKIKTLGVSK